MRWMLLVLGVLPLAPAAVWKQHVGQAGPSGWRCHVIEPDPNDHGPDGFNYHDWDGDGDLDVLVNFEEGGYSRLYFNPGQQAIRDVWTDFIELEAHGTCEDSGIGDLDGDGDVDYVTSVGFVYFNPGPRLVRDPQQWQRMRLFQKELRIPTVVDIDGDELNDLLIGAQTWYRQPQDGQKDPKNWSKNQLSEMIWPMTNIIHDIDYDGDQDILVSDRRGRGLVYHENPGAAKVTDPWPIQEIDKRTEGMFVVMGDVNGDGRLDVVKAAPDVCIYLRTNDNGAPDYHMVEVAIPKNARADSQSSELAKKKEKKKGEHLVSPKGVALLEMNGDPTLPEILIMPEYSAQMWYLSLNGDGHHVEDWTLTLMDVPASETRKKVDNAYLVDLDGDGDLDVATTEENGGWGIIWFENPANR